MLESRLTLDARRGPIHVPRAVVVYTSLHSAWTCLLLIAAGRGCRPEKLETQRAIKPAGRAIDY